jgi:hypothetical protein
MSRLIAIDEYELNLLFLVQIGVLLVFYEIIKQKSWIKVNF